MKAKWLSFAFASFHEFLRIETFQRVTSEKIKKILWFQLACRVVPDASLTRVAFPFRHGRATRRLGYLNRNIYIYIYIYNVFLIFAKPIRGADRDRPDWFLGERWPGGQG